MVKMRNSPKKISPHRLWLGIFGVWAFFLTGIFASFFGGPGILQAIRLQNLLHARNLKLEAFQAQLNEAKAEADLMETSAIVQQREIRRVLGYAAPDEFIFDFSSGPKI